MLRAFLKCLPLLVLASMAAAYDYSDPMPGTRALPLDLPEQPFVLRFTSDELLAQPIWSNRVDAILIPKDAPSPIRIGANALRDSLAKFHLGDARVLELDPKQQDLPDDLSGDRFIVLGVPQDSKLAESLAQEAKLDVSDATLNGDGFYLKPMRRGAHQILLVTSPVPRGVMYGAYELEERTTARGVPSIDEKFAPIVRYRGWPFFAGVTTPAKISGRYRYNLSIDGSFWQRLLPYKDYPELGGEQHKDELLATQQTLHKSYADVAAYGSMPALFFNPLSLQWTPIGLEPARKALAAKYPGILAQPAERYIYSLCPSHPETRKLVASVMRELASTFPELELVELQLSDEGGEVLCDCDACRSRSYFDRVIEYTKLTIDAAHEVNPKLRFMLFGSGITNKGATDNPELGKGPTMGMDYVYGKVGKSIDAIALMATSPPGFDVQTWFTPDSTMLGQGIPTYYYLNWYEAGFPGIVGPISPVMSHLSWPLPLYLDRLKKFAAHGSGMIGGSSCVTGMEVAWWYPNLDPHKYMRNWCRAKYGNKAGDYAYEAMVDTDKITSAFYLDTKPNVNESFDMYRWGKLGQDWAVNMDPLAKVGLGQDDTGQTTLASIAKQSFMFPQAPQPEAFKTLAPGAEMDKWLARFELAEETAIGDRADSVMGKALTQKPENPELRRLHGVARATKALIHLFRDYHLAMVNASAARNVADAAGKARLIESARAHLKLAAQNAAAYKNAMLPITKDDKNVRMKRDTDMFYVSAAACMVREGAYLFDKEFGGESVMGLLDRTMGLGGTR